MWEVSAGGRRFTLTQGGLEITATHKNVNGDIRDEGDVRGNTHTHTHTHTHTQRIQRRSRLWEPAWTMFHWREEDNKAHRHGAPRCLFLGCLRIERQSYSVTPWHLGEIAEFPQWKSPRSCDVSGGGGGGGGGSGCGAELGVFPAFLWAKHAAWLALERHTRRVKHSASFLSESLRDGARRNNNSRRRTASTWITLNSLSFPRTENMKTSTGSVFLFFFYIPMASELQQICSLHTHVRIVRTSCGRHGVEEERWWVLSLPSGVSSGQQSGARPWHHPLAVLHDLRPRSTSPWTWMLIWLLSQPAESQPDPDAISKRKYNEGTQPERMLGNKRSQSQEFVLPNLRSAL